MPCSDQQVSVLHGACPASDRSRSCPPGGVWISPRHKAQGWRWVRSRCHGAGTQRDWGSVHRYVRWATFVSAASSDGKTPSSSLNFTHRLTGKNRLSQHLTRSRAALWGARCGASRASRSTPLAPRLQASRSVCFISEKPRCRHQATD